MLAPGQPAPDFELISLAGDRRHLLGDSPTVLAFFKVSCPTCQLAMPFLDRLAHGSLRVLAVSQNDEATTRRFHAQYGITLNTLLDPEFSFPASNAYALTNVPSLFVVEPDGRISQCFSGFSKADFAALGERAGLSLFHDSDAVPDWKAG